MQRPPQVMAARFPKSGRGIPRSARRRLAAARSSALLLVALLAVASLLRAAGALGQDAQHPVQHDPVSQHHQVQYLLMKDMAAEMARMADEMAAGEPTALQAKDMIRRMERMSVLMHRMSGLAAKPAMSEPQMTREMDKMRREMDAMLHEHGQRPAK